MAAHGLHQHFYCLGRAVLGSGPLRLHDDQLELLRRCRRRLAVAVLPQPKEVLPVNLVLGEGGGNLIALGRINFACAQLIPLPDPLFDPESQSAPSNL